MTMPPMPTIDPGSFRDPDARVFFDDHRVLRGLSDRGRDDWLAAADSGLVGDLVERGWLVEHRLLEDRPPLPCGVPDAAVIEATRVPFISYPYEWTSGMLRDAALLTLDVSIECLERGFQLKDASAYNVAFDNGRPVFIDIGSIKRGYDNAWPGYSQFVSHFLAPLLIQAHAGIHPQALLRAHPEGIPLELASQLLRGRRALRKGVALHVRFAQRATRRSQRMGLEKRREMAAMEVPLAATLANLRRMKKLIESLDLGAESEWGDYEDNNSYSDAAATAKSDFLTAAASRHQGRVAWDVGANAGHYAIALLPFFDVVVGVEPDPLAAERMYGRSRHHEGLQVAMMDITDPSPDRGWRNAERSTLRHRAAPDFSAWLAVVHHLCISHGYPVTEVLDLVGETSAASVVEFVDPADPKALELSASRSEIPHGYSREVFEAAARERFSIEDVTDLSGTRTLFALSR